MALLALRIQDLMFKPEITLQEFIDSSPGLKDEGEGYNIFEDSVTANEDEDGSPTDSPDSVVSTDLENEDVDDDISHRSVSPNIVNPVHGWGFGESDEGEREGKFVVYKRPDESIASQTKSELLRQIKIYQKLTGQEVFVDDQSSREELIDIYTRIRAQPLPSNSMLLILKGINDQVNWNMYNDATQIHRLIYAVTRDHKTLPPIHIQQDVYLKNRKILGQTLNNILYNKFRDNFARYREVSFTLQLINLNSRPTTVDKIIRDLLIKHLSYALVPNTQNIQRLVSNLDEYNSQLVALRDEYVQQLRAILGFEPDKIVEPTLHSLILLASRGPQTEFRDKIAKVILSRIGDLGTFAMSKDSDEVMTKDQQLVYRLYPDPDHHLRVQFDEIIDKLPTLRNLFQKMKDIEIDIKNASIDLKRETIDQLLLRRAHNLVERLVDEKKDAYPFFACIYIVLFNHIGGTSKYIRYMKEKFIAGEFSAQYIASSELNSSLVPELLTLKSITELSEAVRRIYDAARLLERLIKERAMNILYQGKEVEGDIISIGVEIKNIRPVSKLCLNDTPQKISDTDIVLLPSEERNRFYCISKKELKDKVERGEKNPFTGCEFDKDIIFKIK